jgi:hypothetical protein
VPVAPKTFLGALTHPVTLQELRTLTASDKRQKGRQEPLPTESTVVTSIAILAALESLNC